MRCNIIAVLRRFGLVALVVALIVNTYQENFPTTLHLSNFLPTVRFHIEGR